jgi:hypothetical protein
MSEKIKSDVDWKAATSKLLNALRIAEEALEEWGDENTLPFITRTIDEIESEIRDEN